MSDENISELHNLKFDFSIKDRFVNVKDVNGNYFECQTPFLKVLKPIHTTLNKKKTIAKKYLILETNDELDFSNQIGEFMFIINKIHEVSQEKIREKSLQWFNTEFDDIGLDIKVRRPIDQQKDSEFIKISIPIDTSIENEIVELSKGMYVLCDIVFKGLKISSDNITEEWEIKKIITQEKYDEMQNNEYICNNVGNIDLTNTLLENNEDIDPEFDKSNHERVIHPESKENNDNEDSKNIENTSDVEVISIVNIDETENEVQANYLDKSLENLLESESIDESELIKHVKISNKQKNKVNKEKSSINKITENKNKKRESGKNTELIKKFSKKLIFT
jgi:hypothetical protein